ncbi:conjugative transfer system coupling protein TraD [Thioalkalivibrio sp. ALE23]|uniref:conjugative transfer system coupling protein TraD n=1 Tax=Thioalkalivibrio sp. ALE23 TaxID=1265495 RepID=UPI00036C841B|nr:conjugative transfer system coupling protein TraD [Thioalkalivibrio sp. ALE23]
MIFTAKDEYEVPFRPNFELRSAIVWLIAGAATALIGFASNASWPMTGMMMIFILSMGVYRGIQAWPRWAEIRRMRDATLKFIDVDGLQEKMQPGKIWLGRGYIWDKEAANKAYSVLRRGPSQVIGKEPKTNQIGGAYWLQGLKYAQDVYASEKFLEGHTVIVGTTGSGKTRLYDLILTQLILKDQCVIVIDPKGDHELRENMRRACERLGQPERFSMFHPAYPDRSVRFDPLKNWNRGTEIATRITDLMASDGSDPFRDIAWNALNSGIQGMIEVGEKPSLRSIRAYIESGPGDLIARVLPVHFETWSSDWNQRFRMFCSNEGESVDAGKGASEQDQQITKMIAFYTDVVAKTHRSSVVDGLVTAYTHNREHQQKLLASLVPVLSKMTADVLDELLSPRYDDLEDDRPVLDMAKVIRENKVFYVGLDSLADSTVGSSIGSILLADAAAVSGDIYNYGGYGDEGEKKSVWFCIDEASEVLNEPAVRILNKGRGSGMRALLATQTLSDVEVRMGDKPSALQALGNINNKIILRLQDGDTQEYIAKSMPKMKVEDLQTGYREGTGDFGEVQTSRSGYSETLEAEELEAVPPPLFGEIPNLNILATLADGRMMKSEVPILQY